MSLCPPCLRGRLHGSWEANCAGLKFPLKAEQSLCLKFPLKAEQSLCYTVPCR